MREERVFTLGRKLRLEKLADQMFGEYDNDFLLAEAESNEEGIKAIAQHFGVLAIPAPSKTREYDVEFDVEDEVRYVEIKVRFTTLEALHSFKKNPDKIAIEQSKIDYIRANRKKHYILNIFLEYEPGVAHAFMHQIDDHQPEPDTLPTEQRTSSIGNGSTKNTPKYLYDINSPGCIKWDYKTNMCLADVTYRPQYDDDYFEDVSTIDDLGIKNYITGGSYDNL